MCTAGCSKHNLSAMTRLWSLTWSLKWHSWSEGPSQWKQRNFQLFQFLVIVYISGIGIAYFLRTLISCANHWYIFGSYGSHDGQVTTTQSHLKNPGVHTTMNQLYNHLETVHFTCWLVERSLGEIPNLVFGVGGGEGGEGGKANTIRNPPLKDVHWEVWFYCAVVVLSLKCYF